MPLTFNEIIKQAAILARLEEPSGTLFSSTDKDIKLLHLSLVEIGRDLRSEYIFRQLIKTHSFTTGLNDTQYTLPGDFWKMLPMTLWDSSNKWQIAGPVSDIMWARFQYGLISSLTKKRFNIRGADFNSGQFFIDPEPQAGDVLKFDYIRSQWFLPKAWTASEDVITDTTYRSASGNIYLAKTTAASGVTAPSHITGTESDGTVNWLYVVGQTYGSNDRFQADTDFPLIDDDILISGTLWKFKELSRLPGWEEMKFDWKKKVKARATRLGGTKILSLADGGTRQAGDNIPEGNYG